MARLGYWGVLKVLVALAVAAVLAFEVFGISDADAKKRRTPSANSPPDYTFVSCAGGTYCVGNLGADLMIGSANSETLQGGAGKDIYTGGAGPFDAYQDESTSSDLYGGFRSGEFAFEFILDGGGNDRIDLSTTFTPYASTNFTFTKEDRDGDGVEDDLHLKEASYGNDDEIIALNHFGTGRIEAIKFTDKTISGASVPLS